MRRRLMRGFPALSIRNYRLFFIGHFISVTGVWMQRLAQDWLVLQITGSGVAVGATTALQFTPILLAGIWGGHVADRVDRRKLLFATQTAAMLLAIGLGVITLTGHVTVPWIYAFAFMTGVVTVFDNPARHSFLHEMVGSETVTNAVSLTSAVQTGGRIVGPAVAGVAIAAVGSGWAFVLNGATYLAVLVALWRMDPTQLHRDPRAEGKESGALEGVRYAWHDPVLRTTLVVLAIVANFAMNFGVLLPLLTNLTFGADAGTAGMLLSVFAVGSVLGALISAIDQRPTVSRFLVATGAFGLAALGVSLMPSVQLTAVALLPTGVVALLCMTTAQSTLQTHTTPEMRGRVMALFSIVFLGSNPVGAILAGWLAQTLTPRWAIGIGGAVAVVVAAVTALLRRGATDAEAHGREQEGEAAAPVAA